MRLKNLYIFIIVLSLLIPQNNDQDDSACDLIQRVKELHKNSPNVKLYFGNGGDRTNTNSPEVDYCNKNGIELLWGVGGGKIQSSSDLIGKSNK